MPTPTTPATEGRDHVDWIDITDPDQRNLYRRIYRKSGRRTHCFAIGHVYHGRMLRNRAAPINVYSPSELARVPDIKALIAAVDEYLQVEGHPPGTTCNCTECVARERLYAALAAWEDKR